MTQGVRMNNLKKLALVTAFALTVSSFSTAAEAYRCAWRNGHRVCWHENVANVYHYYPRAESRSFVVYTSDHNGCFWRNGYRICR